MNVIEQALYSKLTSTSSITTLLASANAVYNEEAPEGAAFPFVIFGEYAGSGDNDSPHDAIQMLYQLKGSATTGFLQAGAIDAAIRAALHRATLTVTGWTNFKTQWESPIKVLEHLPGGGSVFTVGGVYRLRLAK